MKKFLLGAAAVMALAAPGVANAQSGYIGLSAGTQELDNGGGGNLDDSSEVYGLEGAVLLGAGGLGVELDAAVLDSDQTDEAFSVAGHLFTRNDSYLFGGFVGASDSDDSTTWTAGVEGAKYFDKWTLWGSVGYGNNDDLEADGYGVNGGLSAFATDNLRIDAGIGWTALDIDGDDADLMSYGIGGELALGTVSVGLSWTHAELDIDQPPPNPLANSDSDTLMATLRLNFGSESLLDRDRNGASQAGRSTLGFVF